MVGFRVRAIPTVPVLNWDIETAVVVNMVEPTKAALFTFCLSPTSTPNPRSKFASFPELNRDVVQFQRFPSCEMTMSAKLVCTISTGCDYDYYVPNSCIGYYGV